MGNAERLAPPARQDAPGWPICGHATLIPDGGPAKLLEVARAMGVLSFSTEQLTIAAWLRYPETFGLRGFSKHYPDNNKTISMLSGKRGLVSKGYLRRLAGGLLKVEGV